MSYGNIDFKVCDDPHFLPTSFLLLIQMSFPGRVGYCSILVRSLSILEGCEENGLLVGMGITVIGCVYNHS